MRKLVVIAAGFLLSILLMPRPIAAHHGNAAYDMTKSTTLKGTVTDFEYINPHVEIFFEVKDDKGQVEKWDAEAGNTLALHRHGWSSKSLKTGDVVTFVGNRAKNGSNVMRLQKVVLADGTELSPFPPTD